MTSECVHTTGPGEQTGATAVKGQTGERQSVQLPHGWTGPGVGNRSLGRVPGTVYLIILPWNCPDCSKRTNVNPIKTSHDNTQLAIWIHICAQFSWFFFVDRFETYYSTKLSLYKCHSPHERAEIMLRFKAEELGKLFKPHYFIYYLFSLTFNVKVSLTPSITTCTT